MRVVAFHDKETGQTTFCLATETELIPLEIGPEDYAFLPDEIPELLPCTIKRKQPRRCQE